MQILSIQVCPSKKLQKLMKHITTIPEDFRAHPKIHRIWEQRQKMGEGEREFDWGTAENLAFASLISENYPLRMSGQDVARGTFSQRHAIIYDYETGISYCPHKTLLSDSGEFPLVEIYNSPFV